MFIDNNDTVVFSLSWWLLLAFWLEKFTSEKDHVLWFLGTCRNPTRPLSELSPWGLGKPSWDSGCHLEDLFCSLLGMPRELGWLFLTQCFNSVHPLEVFFDRLYSKLVGGLEHQFYVPIYWDCHHSNWLAHIFQRGFSSTTNQRTLGAGKDLGPSWVFDANIGKTHERSPVLDRFHPRNSTPATTWMMLLEFYRHWSRGVFQVLTHLGDFGLWPYCFLWCSVSLVVWGITPSYSV